ncbi:hypothetical protein [Mangrovicoccus sp. HB161399]|uniref:hypothetical protein n=1 Tax=Mangrovicoccus sp. HB161399 TaxID=2720392 RepID=UPI0015559A00|nr:hypothetical protein [Mangrovicoccus sp. HB161399]
MLVLIGIGLTADNWIGGRLAGRSLWGGAAIGMGALALASLAVPFAVATPAGAATGLAAWAAAACVARICSAGTQVEAAAAQHGSGDQHLGLQPGQCRRRQRGRCSAGAVLWADRRAGPAPLAAE